MVEVWKPIAGYEGIYEVSNLGRVRSLDRIKSNGARMMGRVLLQDCSNRGYMSVELNVDKKNKRCSIHRLVAMAFIPNPNNLPEVNHKDENKLNNNVCNLEWCTPSYNSNYGTRNERLYKKYNLLKEKPIAKYDSNGNLVATYKSIAEAGRINGNRNSIRAVLSGRTKRTIDGCSYKYIKTSTNESNQVCCQEQRRVEA